MSGLQIYCQLSTWFHENMKNTICILVSWIAYFARRWRQDSSRVVRYKEMRWELWISVKKNQYRQNRLLEDVSQTTTCILL